MKPATADDVLDLMDAYFTSIALGTAMELGLFWLLDEKPLDTASVAGAFGIPINRCRYWLQLLSRTGLIEQGTDGYAPSSTARAAILDSYRQDSWALLAEEARQRYQGLSDLPLRISNSDSAWEPTGHTPSEYVARMVENPEAARRFTLMLYDLHEQLAEELAKILDMSGVDRLMDLGGGSGVVSLALLRRYSNLTSVVVDIANVCAAGREIAAENSLGERITYHQADFLQDELPSGFDMILECDVNVYSEALFAKIRTALNPGGRFVIVDQFAPAEGVAPPSRIHWAFHGSLLDPGFSFPTATEIKSQLVEAGFQILSEDTLPPIAGAAARFTKEMVVIEAS
ncbi:MAG: methyltransferase [Candidatus Glassbacteria bacterium]